jgi:hypothetical protein
MPPAFFGCVGAPVGVKLSLKKQAAESCAIEGRAVLCLRYTRVFRELLR